MIQITTNNDVMIAVFQQDINFETTRIMEEILLHHTYSNISRLQIDLSAVRFIDSSGVRLFISWLYPLKDRIHIEIIGASAPIKNVLSICQIDQFVDVK
ncbi:STAS domain-containing protein [Anoxybacillus rupiensis]|uniref:STAS domain-containing protein n=1 Tax=Anoxybacteroides rupiense TaxID=311460 RepID=UPI001BAA8021|nr:STAS domain-containing protein [Anoxybacillus rupiensis]MBS2772189.1 STAS domain-containing protein [Anoxybacillus rupiensis]